MRIEPVVYASARKPSARRAPRARRREQDLDRSGPPDSVNLTMPGAEPALQTRTFVVLAHKRPESSNAGGQEEGEQGGGQDPSRLVLSSRSVFLPSAPARARVPRHCRNFGVLSAKGMSLMVLVPLRLQRGLPRAMSARRRPSRCRQRSFHKWIRLSAGKLRSIRNMARI